MNPSELRIGNYVTTFIPSEFRGVQMIFPKICEIRNNGVVFIQDGPSDEWKVTPFNKIYGVLIDVEHLEAFGFEQDGDIFSKGYLHYNLDTNYFYSGNDHISGGNPDTKVEYVHQLQNLYFALTAEELTLNNKHV